MDDIAKAGAEAPVNDDALFNAITSREPPAAENPTTETQPASQAPAAAAPAVTQPAAQQPVAASPAQSEPAIPPARLREEAEARRAAERERDEMRGHMASLQRQLEQLRQPAQPQQPPDIFENPTEAIRHQVGSQVGPQFDEMKGTILTLTRELANVRHTPEVVDTAEAAFMKAIQDRTLDAADYHKVVSSPNRYAAAVEWHKRQQVLAEVGNDPAAYRQRTLDEALKDPAFLARALEASRAAASGNPVIQQPGATAPSAQPAKPAAAVTSLPSLAHVGATAQPQSLEAVSDADLFKHTIGRKRA
jgi:hypothetical protein